MVKAFGHGMMAMAGALALLVLFATWSEFIHRIGVETGEYACIEEYGARQIN